MGKFENIYNVYNAEFELIKQQSALLLQRQRNGFNGELKASGYLVEQFVKDLLNKHLPFGYRICSGYIATLDNISSDDNLIQHDVIIVDSRVPSLHKFSYGDVEIVPAEAVCGIFEVKRTLNKDVLKNAIEHLNITAKLLDNTIIKSKEKAINNACGPTINNCTTAPVYGIIGLSHDNELDGCSICDINTTASNFLDIVWSLSTPYLRYIALFDSQGNEFFPENTSRNQEYGNPPYTMNYVCSDVSNNADTKNNFAKSISRIQTWISHTSKYNFQSDSLQKYLGLT